jgi:hypothetical protein
VFLDPLLGVRLNPVSLRKKNERSQDGTQANSENLAVIQLFGVAQSFCKMRNELKINANWPSLTPSDRSNRSRATEYDRPSMLKPSEIVESSTAASQRCKATIPLWQNQVFIAKLYSVFRALRLSGN